MTLAITTRIIPATNTKPMRVVAENANGHRITLSWDSLPDGNVVSQHWIAAKELRDKLDWPNLPMTAGGIKGGYAFVYVDEIFGGEEE